MVIDSQMQESIKTLTYMDIFMNDAIKSFVSVLMSVLFLILIIIFGVLFVISNQFKELRRHLS